MDVLGLSLLASKPLVNILFSIQEKSLDAAIALCCVLCPVTSPL